MSTRYRDRDAPLPPDLQAWCMEDEEEDFDKTTAVMTQWRTAWDIASRILRENRTPAERPDWTDGAPDYLHSLSFQLTVMVNFRLRALLGEPLKPLDELLQILKT